MKRLLPVFIGIMLVLFLTPVYADVPQIISYQGQLTDSLGMPLPGGSYDLTFSIYAVAEGGSALWSSGPQAITINNGLFEYSLGSNVPFIPYLFQMDTLHYLGISINGGSELEPRTRFMTVAYAFKALQCDTAAVSLSVADNVIMSQDILNGQVQFEDIGQNGASTGQVMKWNGSAWAASDDDAGSNTSGWVDSANVVKLENADDNVGIGTSSPQGRLHVMTPFSEAKFGTSNEAFRADHFSGSYALIGSSNNGVYGHGNSYGVYGTTASGYGVYGGTSSGGTAVYGYNSNGNFGHLGGSGSAVYGSAIVSSKAGDFDGKVTIDGMVGIGSSFDSPDVALHIQDDDPFMKLATTGNYAGIIFAMNTSYKYSFNWSGTNNEFALTNVTANRRTFVIDDATNKLGINLNNGESPISSMHLRGSMHVESTSRDLSWKTGEYFQMGEWDGSTFTERLRINDLGYVGIGTTNPLDRLQVSGVIRLDNGAGNGNFIRFVEDGTMKWSILHRPWSNAKFAIYDEVGGNNMLVFEEGTAQVGVYTDTPEATLHVNGDVIIEDNLTVNGWIGFPKPNYSSGWLKISKGQTIQINHSLGGDANDYVIDVQFKETDTPAFGIHGKGYGGWFYGASETETNRGAYWHSLTTTSVKVYRQPDDYRIQQVRVRIWRIN